MPGGVLLQYSSAAATGYIACIAPWPRSLNPEDPAPSSSPGSPFRHPFVPRLLFLLAGAAKLPFRLFERVCPGPVSGVPTGKLPARAMDAKEGCLHFNRLAVLSCMMQRDIAATLLVIAHGQWASPDPARCKMPRPPKDRYDPGRCINITQRALFCATHEKEREASPFTGRGGEIPLLDAAWITP